MRIAKKLFLIIFFLALFDFPSYAQDITGIWQGTLSATRDLRFVIKISKADDGALKAIMYSIDQGAQATPASTVTVQASSVKILVPGIGAVFEGKFSGDGNSISGTWTQGPTSLPLSLMRVSTETAWPIPEGPPPLKPMAADSDPAFEVAVIKPSNPDEVGQGFGVNGNQLFTMNTTANNLIAFAYGLDAQQISNAPAWLASIKYDLLAKPDGEGQPNLKQWQTMLQKLLVSRFGLSFHREKKELSVYTITIAKSGPKLTPSTGDPDGLPTFNLSGRGTLAARNATMADFASQMQSSAMDHPVLDQTGLRGRFDFTLNWTPDQFQFAGLDGRAPSPKTDASELPNLFTAMQQQLGLKLESTKAPADVLVIDHAEEPSPN